ncbi:MAG: pantetheine-phosphate adenylyltransferase [Candidatus Omnitrophica bacterium]|nr:pantetheine-phosphate adenylyltransferase [Candidatus Omnitrophota bacterium]
MTKRAVYPGTFDPVTYGHIDLIKRARRIFNEVIVAVAPNTNKAPLFSVEERMDFLRRATRHIPGVVVDQFDSLLVDYLARRKCTVVIRGLRMLSDLEYEFQMAFTNRKLSDKIETIYLIPSESHAYVSSSLVREAGLFGADLSPFVPSFVAKALRQKVSKNNK